MSLILDALNRADRERGEQALSKQLQAEPVAPGQPTSPAWRFYRDALVVTLLIAGAIGFYLWLTTRSQPGQVTPPPTPAAVPAEATVAPLTDAAAAIATQPTASGINTRIDTAGSADAAKNTATAPTSGGETATAVNTPRPSEANRDAIALLYQQPPAPDREPTRATAQPASPKVVAPAPAPQPPLAQPKATPGRNDILQRIPLLHSMSAQFQQRVPSIDYGVHVYNEQEGRGAVKLNGQLCRVGTQIAPGLRVIAILPDSVVLDLNGTQFRLAALNSWMNFQ